jgi:hypothetical protein
MKPMTALRWLVIPMTTLAFGCGDPGAGTGHGHQHDSAHGGVAVELGDHEYHLDLLLSSDEGRLTAWVMDAHVQDFVRIAAPSFDMDLVVAGQTSHLPLIATANPATGEAVGNTSHFQGAAAWLQGASEFTGTIRELEIRGRRFTNVSFAYRP